MDAHEVERHVSDLLNTYEGWKSGVVIEGPVHDVSLDVDPRGSILNLLCTGIDSFDGGTCNNDLYMLSISYR